MTLPLPLWVESPGLGTQKPQSHLRQVTCHPSTRHTGPIAHTTSAWCTLRKASISGHGDTWGSKAEGAQSRETLALGHQASKGDSGLKEEAQGYALSVGRRVAGGGHSPPGLQCPTAPGSPVYCPPSRWLSSCQTWREQEEKGQPRTQSPGLPTQANVVPRVQDSERGCDQPKVTQPCIAGCLHN